MQAINLQPAGDKYRFSVLVPAPGSPTGNELVSGTVSADGTVQGVHRGPGRRIACPICLVRGTLIATPSGPVPVQDVHVGMPVWSTDLQGRRIRATVLEVGSMQAPLGHEVIRLRFADGRVVLVSPGHHVADGRMVGELRPGDVVDGALVVEAAPLQYSGWTYDLLPSGPTGTYFADRVLLASTLTRLSTRPT
jgi:hypothetical protein